MKALLELIKKLYGSKAIQKTLGTRTNVITLPDKETKRFVTSELNIDAASDAAVKKAYEDVEKLIVDIPKMNDQEILTLTGNLRRLDNRINPPSAEVIEFGTKQPVSPTGIKQLAAESGQMSPPGTLMGDLESRLNQLRSSGKKLEDITKGKGMSFEDLIKDPTRSGGALDPRVGIVRTAAREILEKNLKAGKIDIPDKAAKDAILKSYQGGTDPIDVLRQTYGEGVLEQLDDIADELNRAKDYKDIQKILQREKLFDATPKKTYGYDEGVYSDEEMAKILSEASDKPTVISADSPEGKKITEALIGKPKAQVTELMTTEKIISDVNKMDPMDAMKEVNEVVAKRGKYKNLKDEDVKKIFDETNDNIFQRNIPEEPEDFATGGRVGFQGGGTTEDETLSNPTMISTVMPSMRAAQKALSNPVVQGIGSLVLGGMPALANFVKGQVGGYLAGKAISPMISDYVAQARRAAGINEDTFGVITDSTYGVDDVNEGSVTADASAGGAAGAAAASAAGANDGPGTGGSFAQGGRVGYSTGSIVKGVLLTAKTLSELKPEYLKKLSRLEGYLGSINMEGKGGREAAKKTIEKIDNLKQEYKALEKDLSKKQELENFDTTDRSKNARGGVAYLMGL